MTASLFAAAFPLPSLQFQGQWGTTSREMDAEMERRRAFVENNVSAFRSEFIVLQESFKVTYYCTSLSPDPHSHSRLFSLHSG